MSSQGKGPWGRCGGISARLPMARPARTLPLSNRDCLLPQPGRFEGGLFVRQADWELDELPVTPSTGTRFPLLDRDTACPSGTDPAADRDHPVPASTHSSTSGVKSSNG